MAIPILTKKEAGKLQAATDQEPQDQEALERKLKEFAGGLPYDRARVIERTQDGFRLAIIQNLKKVKVNNRPQEGSKTVKLKWVIAFIIIAIMLGVGNKQHNLLGLLFVGLALYCAITGIWSFIEPGGVTISICYLLISLGMLWIGFHHLFLRFCWNLVWKLIHLIL